MTSADKPMWLENLEEWILDENRLVTAKLVSRELRVHINTAKERLFHFAKVHRAGHDLEVILLLAGRGQDGVRTVRLVRESAEPEASTQMSEITSKHVYAVGRKSVVGKGDQALTLALMDAAKDDPYLNTFSAIVNKKAVPRNNAVSIEKPAPVVEEVIKVEKEKEKAPASAAPAVAAERVSQPKCYPGKKGKSGGAIANMFAKVASKKKDDDTVGVSRKQGKAEARPESDGEGSGGSRKRKGPPEASPETSPGKENRANEEREKEEEERRLARLKKEEERRLAKLKKEEADKKKRSKGAAKNSQQKRKRIQIMSDSESSGAEEEDVDVDRIEAAADSPPPPQAPLIESDDEDMIPPTPETKDPKCQPANNRRKRSRKLVEKTFKDEDGFTVTKKEYESCSEPDDHDDQEEEITVLAASKKGNAAASVAAPKAVVKEPAAKKAKAKKKDESPHKTKQASIMNFFKKK